MQTTSTGAGAHEHVADLQRLLAVVGLETSSSSMSRPIVWA